MLYKLRYIVCSLLNLAFFTKHNVRFLCFSFCKVLAKSTWKWNMKKMWILRFKKNHFEILCISNILCLTWSFRSPYSSTPLLHRQLSNVREQQRHSPCAQAHWLLFSSLIHRKSCQLYISWIQSLSPSHCQHLGSNHYHSLIRLLL